MSQMPGLATYFGGRDACRNFAMALALANVKRGNFGLHSVSTECELWTFGCLRLWPNLKYRLQSVSNKLGGCMRNNTNWNATMQCLLTSNSCAVS